MPSNAPEHDVTAAAKRLRLSAAGLGSLAGPQKNACLEALGSTLLDDVDDILASARDDAAHAQAEDAPAHVVDSIQITRAALEEKAKLAGTLGGLPDPVGRLESTWIRPNGLKIEKVRVPLGVVAVLIEFQPLVAIDAVLLCLKAGNAVLLQAGPMIYRTCQQIANVLSRAELPEAVSEPFFRHLPGHGVPVRRALVTQRQLVDVAIPVGREEWVSAVVADATVPVLCERPGSCQVYVDDDAELDMALDIVGDSVGREGAGCRAEVVLVHRGILSAFGPRLVAEFLQRQVPFSADDSFRRAIEQAERVDMPAIPAHGGRVHLAVVDDLDEAAAWIADRGAGHSDAIVTNNRQAALRFIALVDSASVYINASIRFTGGAQFGMGSQIAISTGRMHARGPIAIDELTTYKYVVTGKGQTLS